MTSTGMFQGFGAETRNSSRVLNAPGGASSDIFGLGNATSTQSIPQKTKVTPPYASTPPTPPKTAAQSLPAESQPSKTDASSIVTQSKPKSSRQQGGNPITGEYYDVSTKTSTVVRQPPGGKSSISFGSS